MIYKLFHNIVVGLKNLWLWLPIIWNDRQWDHHFFYLLLKHKLELMEDYFRHSAITLDSKKDANKIRLCIFLVNRILEDNYYERATRHLPYINLLSHNSNEYRREIKRKLWVERARMLSRQDLRYLGKLISKHSLSWWD
jgi:hypothetical protein